MRSTIPSNTLQARKITGKSVIMDWIIIIADSYKDSLHVADETRNLASGSKMKALNYSRMENWCGKEDRLQIN